MGGFKAAISEAQKNEKIVLLNCAGKKLHTLLPKTKEPFDILRNSDRVLDLEWLDMDTFVLELSDIIKGIHWTIDQIEHKNNIVLVNCAQGKSRYVITKLINFVICFSFTNGTNRAM